MRVQVEDRLIQSLDALFYQKLIIRDIVGFVKVVMNGIRMVLTKQPNNF